MKLLVLHDMNNPSQTVPIDPSDYSVAVPCGSGSAIRMKSSDAPILVHETPEQIAALLAEE